MIGAGIWLVTFIYAKTLKRKDLAKSTFLLFSWMQVFTAAGFAFSHGANDIANAIGPFAAIMDVLRTDRIGVSAPVPSIVLLTFGIALIVGLWFIGKEVIATVGTSLAEMHPCFGFYRRAVRRLGRHGRFDARPAGIQHAHSGGSGAGHRPGQPQRQLESDETDRFGLGYHPARRLAAVGALLFRPANGFRLKRFAAAGI